MRTSKNLSKTTIRVIKTPLIIDKSVFLEVLSCIKANQIPAANPYIKAFAAVLTIYCHENIIWYKKEIEMTRIASLFLAFFVAVAFSACGNTKDPSQDNKNNSIQNNTVVSNTVDMPQNVEQNSPLEIELVGESKVIIRLTHESINEGLANKDESFLAAYEMYFLANENLKINFRLNRYDSITIFGGYYCRR